LNISLFLDLAIGIPLMLFFYLYGGIELLFLVGLPMQIIITKTIQLVFETLLTTEDAKTLREASNAKATAVLVAYDDGSHELQYVKQRFSEGAIKTNKGLIFALMRPNEDLSQKLYDEHGKEVTVTSEVKKTIQKITSTKAFLRKSRIPLLVAYAGKAVAITIEALSSIQNPNPLSEVEVTQLKTLFPELWDQSSIQGIELTSEWAGMKEGKKFFGMENMKYMIIALIVIAAMGIGAMIVIHFLG
jgi:hypothetical protein